MPASASAAKISRTRGSASARPWKIGWNFTSDDPVVRAGDFRFSSHPEVRVHGAERDEPGPVHGADELVRACHVLRDVGHAEAAGPVDAGSVHRPQQPVDSSVRHGRQPGRPCRQHLPGDVLGPDVGVRVDDH